MVFSRVANVYDGVKQCSSFQKVTGVGLHPPKNCLPPVGGASDAIPQEGGDKRVGASNAVVSTKGTDGGM